MNNIYTTIQKMSINERKDGRYEGRITVNGKRVGFYGSTKVEVRQKAKEYLQKIENGYKEPKKIKLNDYIEYWLRTYKLNKIENSSYTRLFRVYECQIKNGIGKKLIGNITTADIQTLIDEHANPPDNSNIKPLAMSGLKRLLQLLRPCFQMAVKEEIIQNNVCNDVILPNKNCIAKRTINQITLNDDELKDLKQHCLDKYKTTNEYRSRDGLVILIILNLGLRAGEMLACEWSDIDMNKKLIYINKTMQSNNKNFSKEGNATYSCVKHGTKTNCGRVLSINDTTLYYIQELKEYDKKHNINCEYVCATSSNTRQTYRNLERSLKRIVNRTNIKHDITLHTLRHTFGSTLIRRGVGIEVVSKLMGHSNITITYNKYIHIIQEQEAAAMNMIKVC